MNLRFFLNGKNRAIPNPEPVEISYEDSGHICSAIVYGKLDCPEVTILSPEALPFTLISRYWFFMNISWSKQSGFEFRQYSDPKISTSLTSTVGKLRNKDKIQINDGDISLIFRAKVDRKDFSDNDPGELLEKCSQFGITITDFEFSNLRSALGFECPNCQLLNVDFVDCDLRGANFYSASFRNVRFINSRLDNADFTNSQFSRSEFSTVDLTGTIFDRCTVARNRSQIENDEVLLFNKNCNLANATFKKAILCSKFEESNLSGANFAEAQLIACRFYGCIFNGTKFIKSRFLSFVTRPNKSQKQSANKEEVIEAINCSIQAKKEAEGESNGFRKGRIENCRFDGASMKFVDLSYNIIINTSFASTDLYKAKLNNCRFIKTRFDGKMCDPAKLSLADLSFSHFEQQCNLSAVDLFRAKTIGIKVKGCSFIRTNFYDANLKGSYFFNTNLTGADFRYADLTLLTLDRCVIKGANFFQTKRGGIDLKVKKIQERENFLKSNCIIDSIEWSPKTNGEIQIDCQSFLQIICGHKSPIAIISNLSKEGAQFILNTYATANAKNAGEDLNDASTNVSGDANNSKLKAGGVETNPAESEEEEENREYDDFSDDESLNDEFSDDE